MLRLLTALAWCGACGDDAAVEGSRHGQGSDRPDAQVQSPTTADPSDASVAYTFPCLWEREPTHEATFASVYLDIFCHVGCVNPYCHGSRGAWGSLDLASSIDLAYANLVGHRTGLTVPADGRATCRDSTLLRVAPGAPERSVLYLKISGAAPCGTRMPPAGSGLAMLAPEQIEQVRRWIEAGAPLGDTRLGAGAPDPQQGHDASIDASADAAPSVE
jgi:hypothetical protein